jgi:hypothetical protein
MIKNDRIKILPKTIDNVYKGNLISKYVFLLLTVVTIVRSLIHIFAADGGAHSIATIPLDSYTSEGAATVIMIFSLWGLAQLLMSVVYGVVYLRYKSLISAMYVLLIIEYIMRIVIGIMKPIVTVGTAPGGIGNYILVPLCVTMLLLSLIKSKKYKEDYNG